MTFVTNTKAMIFTIVFFTIRENHIHSISVAKFAAEEIEPYVREMDEKSKIKQSVLDGLFANGVSLFN